MALSRRYINDRFLPDKAIDLMDEAASQVRMAAESASPDLKDLEEKIAALGKEKEEAVAAQDFEKARSAAGYREELSGTGGDRAG